MNCIFICIFNRLHIKLLYLLLESIFIFGNLHNDTEILIYTSSEFRKIIENSHLFAPQIKFEINDTYNDTSHNAMLDLFNLTSASKYKKFLYLATDIIVTQCGPNDINCVFEIAKEDILYTLEELFGDTSILLFNNCENIRLLFNEINRKNEFVYDPVNLNRCKYGLYDNQKLKQFAINQPNSLRFLAGKVINHFPDNQINVKIEKIENVLTMLKDICISNIIQRTKTYIDEYLLDSTDKYYMNKVNNISNLVLNRNIKNVMEIGFNSWFSVLLMLLSNPYVKITCFDLGDNKNTLPCYKKLKETFGDRVNLIDQLRTVNDAFDLIHIDGGHSTEVAENDIIHAFRLSKKGTILIMDDYDFLDLHELWDKYVHIYDLKPLDVYTYSSPHHDIKYSLR